MLKREEAAQRMGNLLTRRELEIMRLVLKNFTNEQVAEKLCIGAGTVKTHVHSIYEKLGISGRVELARLAQEKGLV
jgi:DNA-binding NarL/FixJ family response regulator